MLLVDIIYREKTNSRQSCPLRFLFKKLHCKFYTKYVLTRFILVTLVTVKLINTSSVLFVTATKGVGGPDQDAEGSVVVECSRNTHTSNTEPCS
jgi:hypothetical protein